MNLKKKEQTRPLILYEKYKQENNVAQKRPMNIDKKNQGPGRIAGNLLFTAILIIMAGLAAIGLIILVNPEGRELLINILNP